MARVFIGIARNLAFLLLRPENIKVFPPTKFENSSLNLLYMTVGQRRFP